MMGMHNARNARVAKSADAKDLKSFSPQGECGFKSRPGHQWADSPLQKTLAFELHPGLRYHGQAQTVLVPERSHHDFKHRDCQTS
jgi:hypothetical protein